MSHSSSRFFNTQHYVSALRNRAITLSDIPESALNPMIYLAAVHTGEPLEKIPVYARNYAICKVALQNNGLDLLHIPTHFHHNELYSIAIRENGRALQFVTPERRDYQLCLEAVQTTGSALEFVPLAQRDMIIYLEALYRDQSAIKYVPYDLDLYLRLVQENGLLLSCLPQKTLEICLAAIKQNPEAFLYMPTAFKTRELYLEMSQRQHGLMQSFPSSMLDEELCLAAVRMNSRALRYVPNHLREHIINQVGLHALLTNNFFISEFISPEMKNYSLMQNYLDHVPSIIEYVVTSASYLNFDHETFDAFHVFAQQPKHRGKTTYVNSWNLRLFLQLQQTYNQHINLVLLDHANEDSMKLARFTPHELVDVLAKYPNIKQVTLLGCNTAKAKPFNSELAARKKLRKTALLSHVCGLVLRNHFSLADCERLLAANLTAVFVLCKSAETHRLPKLIYLEKQADATYIKIFDVQDNQLKTLQNIFNHGKSFSNTPLVMRNLQHPLTIHELYMMDSMFGVILANKFNPRHPAYKSLKAAYPFLSTAHISEDEVDKLTTSLLQKTVQAIGERKEITRPIIIKGVNGLLHVDTGAKEFITTGTFLYLSNYKTSTFFNNAENIKREKLNKQRQKNLKEIIDTAPLEETKHQAIKVYLNSRYRK